MRRTIVATASSQPTALGDAGGAGVEVCGHFRRYWFYGMVAGKIEREGGNGREVDGEN